MPACRQRSRKDSGDKITTPLTKDWGLYGQPMISTSSYADLDEVEQVESVYAQAMIMRDGPLLG